MRERNQTNIVCTDQSFILQPIMDQISVFLPGVLFHWHVNGYKEGEPAIHVGSFKTKTKAKEEEKKAKEKGYRTEFSDMHAHGLFGLLHSATHVGYLNDRPHEHTESGVHYL